MEQKNQKWDKIIELFFEYPAQSFTIREIAKKANVPTSTVQRYLQKLKKEGFITADNKAIISPYLKFKKACFMIDKMFCIGLFDYLEKSLHPSAIVVFGSVRKGEYEKGSDIDLFIETTKEAKLDFSAFEKKLQHRVQLFIEKDINRLPPKLLNNIINGIKVSGYFKVR